MESATRSWGRRGICLLLVLVTGWALGACDADTGPRPRGVPAGAEAVTITAHVDGDTVRVMAAADGAALRGGVETRVRLLEIDAPESVRPDHRVECFGEEASAALAELLPRGSTAWVVPDQELEDRFGRTLLYLWNDAGVFVNERMILDGHATAVLFEPNDRYIDTMRAAEASARSAGAGLWGTCRG
ncbi:thermonuclease family protein [Nocardioides sp.]|uniref:thermonuclease family protein n=1 Tax=Nocardioides sp. TaxID=35761 RepID=UPI00273728D4|nr:thermonuclease family protein [Nocardioides sp.]MDP3890967.1 thermonuclease family protein [Nocardioides sp.]